MTYSFLSYKLVTSFSTFLIFFLSGKNGKLYEVHVISLGIEDQLQENISHHILHYNSL